MKLSLDDVLQIAGELKDDSPSKNTFRKLLDKAIREEIEEYVDAALEKSGIQYARALQDLVNTIGKRLGFEVNYGLYQGKQGEIGHDGLWKSSTGRAVVVETKTTTAYEISPAVLKQRIEQLASHGQVNAKDCVGLYILGKSGSSVLEDAIRGAGLAGVLQVITCDSLLKIYRRMEEDTVDHRIILSWLWPPDNVNIDRRLELMETFSSPPEQEQVEVVEKDGPTPPPRHITPQKAYSLPLLESLIEMGGRAAYRDVMAKVGAKMKERLLPADYEGLSSNPSQIRWQNAVAWERMRLKQQGHLSGDSPSGIWEITDAGRKYYEGLKAKSVAT